MADLSGLNKEQKKAVTHKDGPLLIVAGAGTGKTTVITRRLAWLIEQGLAKPDEILCLTFTDKAAGEMEERIDKILPFGYVDLWVMTFHSFCERILRQYGVEIGLPRDFKILDETSQYVLVSRNLEKFDLDYYRPLGNPSKFISSLLTHFSRAKDECISPDQYLDYVEDLSLDADSPEFLQFGEEIKSPDKENAAELWTQEIGRRKELANAYHSYQKILLDNNSVDFGDLIVYTKQLLLERPAVLERLRKQFKYINVDEFQDTNWAQYDLIKLIAQPSNNITVVGDDDQSVYKFRGASISNILGFKSDFPDSEQVVLSQNYRSCQNILDLAHAFIQHNNPHRLEYQLSEDKELVEEAKEHQVDVSKFKAINKQLKACHEDEGSIEYLHYSTLQDEAAGVVEKIGEIRKQKPDSNWGDFAILVRANNTAEPFLQALSVAQIPYQFMASQGLFSKAEVLDIISYLTLLNNHSDNTSMYRLLILPTLKLSNSDLMSILHYARKKAVNLVTVLKQCRSAGLSEDGIKICEDLLTKIDKHTTLARNKRVSEIAMTFVDDYSLKQYYETLDPQAQRDTYALLNHFWKIMNNFEAGSDDKSVKAFLAHVDMMKEAGDSGSLPQDAEYGPDTVKVMTIHASKGLEFKYVFLVSMVDRRFPTSERKDPLPLPEELIKEVVVGDNHHLEEERRLCYVALTRAKLGLFLTSAEDYGGARKKKPSKFVVELGFEKPEPIKRNAGLFDKDKGLKVYSQPRTFDYKSYIPRTFSYTQFKVFQTCPWQYRYAFIMKIPVQGRHTFSFGKTLHHTLQKFFNNMMEHTHSPQTTLFGEGKGDKDFEPKVEDLLDLYEECWIDDWYLSPEHKKEYYEKGREIVKEFFKLHKNKWPKTEATEKGFTLKIGDYVLRGSIDRIDRGEKGLKLIDYKTGKVPKNDRSLDKDQLLIYQIAAEEILGEEVEELTYYYLNEQTAKSFLGAEKDKDKLKEKIMSTFDELVNSRFEPKPSKIVCSHCDFKDICPYRML